MFKNKFRNKAVFLDRDGTLIEDKNYLSDPKQIILLPYVIPALKLLQKYGFKLIITTNQSGIERGYFTLKQLKEIHKKLKLLLIINNIKLDAIYWCPHHPDRKCFCRKPNIGMIKKAQKKFNLDIKKCFSIGDKLSDIEFIQRVCGKGILVLTGKGRDQKKLIKKSKIKPDYIATNLYTAAKWIVKRLFIFLFFISSLYSQEFIWRKIENNVFKVGEKFTYNIRWGFISTGEANLVIDSTQTVFSRIAFHIVAQTKSYPFFDIIYKVRNKDESWMDVESLCSLKYLKSQREGGYSKDEDISFDYINHKFMLIEDKNITKTGNIPEYIQDILSALYYCRIQNFNTGNHHIFTTQAGDKNYELKVFIYKTETVKVPVGEFKCFMVEPVVHKEEMIFRTKGKLWIWFSADNKKIPVLMKSKISIGYITAELIDYKL